MKRADRPEVLLKVASTLDGAVATRTGESQWVTGALARARGRALRGEVDAILVGVNTVLADDPRLTARQPGLRDPVRVVLDSDARTPPKARLVTDAAAPTWILVGAGAATDRCSSLAETAAEVLSVPRFEGRVDLEEALKLLRSRGIRTLLVEGGPTVVGAFVDARAVDRVAWFLAPKVVGGREARHAVGGMGVGPLTEALVLETLEREVLGEDLLLLGRVRS